MTEIHILEENKRSAVQTMQKASEEIKRVLSSSNRNDPSIRQNIQKIWDSAAYIKNLDLKTDATIVSINKRLERILKEAVKIARSE